MRYPGRMGRSARVIFGGASYDVREGESMLDALIRGGANVSFSCRKGTCHACLLKATAGDPGRDSSASLRAELRDKGYFLPCKSHPNAKVWLEPPDPADCTVRIHLHEKEALSSEIVRLRFEPETNVTWHAGQYANLRRDDGVVRSYSLASIPEEDYFLEVHVKRIEGGQLSPWLADEIEEGDSLDMQGPFGACYYDQEKGDHSLLLLATGSGLAPLWGVLRDALRLGHTRPIHLVHGSHRETGLYLRNELRRLASEHENFRYTPCLPEGHAAADVETGRVIDLAFGAHPDLSDSEVYLCGLPDMVYEARYRAVLAGALRARIHADPFEYAHPYQPDDAAKLKALPEETALWAALGQGEGLRAILEDFYGRAFQDPRLAPFFHNVTKTRAIDKQYEFLSTAFTGEGTFFGLRPFNAHHWMIISDELFDYREEIMDDCVRRRGLPEALHRRWRAFHEAFRREIVKSTARGMYVDGIERTHFGFSDETLEIANLCDACGNEMGPGTIGRMHRRTGKLYCGACASAPLRLSDQPPGL